MPDNQINNLNDSLSRFIKYLDYKGITYKNAEILLQVGNGRIGKMIKNNTEIKQSFKENILQKFSDLNRSWFEYESGEMIVDPADHSSTTKSIENQLSQLKSEFLERERMLRELIAEKDKRLAEKDIRLAEKDEVIKGLKEQLATKSTKVHSATDTGSVQR